MYAGFGHTTIIWDERRLHSHLFQERERQRPCELPFILGKHMNIKGWHYGVLRSSVFKRMLELLPVGCLYTCQELKSYTELGDAVEIKFVEVIMHVLPWYLHCTH